MRILAIETAGRQGSLALVEADPRRFHVVADIALTDAHGRTAQALTPALAHALGEADWPTKSVDLVGVVVGPGSFTGLRIGVTAAKTFAYAVGAEIVGVNTLEVLAEATPPAATTLWTILDAQRLELFAAKFLISNVEGNRQTLVGMRIVTVEEWLDQLQPGDRVTGPPLTKLASRLPDTVVALSTEFWDPTATSVARVAWRAYQNGWRDDVWKLAPQYYRPSAAEEKAARRGGA